jgi:hypothetical protein
MLTVLTFKLASLATAAVISAAAVVGLGYRKGRRDPQLAGKQFRCCLKNQAASGAAGPAGEPGDEVLPVEERGLPWTS